jgi:hypothetical protein
VIIDKIPRKRDYVWIRGGSPIASPNQGGSGDISLFSAKELTGLWVWMHFEYA